MEHLHEEQAEPVSPMGQYFNSSALCIYIIGVLEFEVPIHDLQTFTLIKDVFLPINPRFSSIMVLSLLLTVSFIFMSILSALLEYYIINDMILKIADNINRLFAT